MRQLSEHCSGRTCPIMMLQWQLLRREGVVSRVLFAAIAMLVVLPAPVSHARNEQSTEEIKKAIIQESIAAYRGSCPCPYNTARNGGSCGGRSAYSRPGGYSPLCYPKDVTDDMVRQYKMRQR